MHIYDLTFEGFKKIWRQFFDNIKVICKGEEWTSLPVETCYPYNYVTQGMSDGELNESNFKDSWVVQRFVEEWNNSMAGSKYVSYKDKYEQVVNDPDSLEILNTINDKTSFWGYHGRKFESQMKYDKKPSFYIFYRLYMDTKSPFRHWWDTYNNDDVFKVGDMVELRSTANRNHIMKGYRYTSGTEVLRSVGYTTSQSLKGNLLMVLAYQEKSPPQTYSYKKGKGGTKMVTLLPVGSTEKIYIAEQFLKVSRKQGVKEARGKKK